MDKETLTLVLLALLIGPPILFGIWMRIKLMQSEKGREFLVDREQARVAAEDQARILDDETEQHLGKVARMGTDIAASEGTYGENVADLLKKAVPFILVYFGYAIVLIVLMVFWLG